ncbi:MAG: hypothetical protein ABH863_06200 [Candidatus Micrarchaeota archaeon]
MEFAADLGLLEKLEVAGLMPAMDELFGDPHWVVAPCAYRELNKKKRGAFGHFAANSARHIATKMLSKKERKFISGVRKKWPGLSRQEAEAIAVAKAHGLIYLTSEPIARMLCIETNVRYMTLPMLLKALWAKKIRSRKQITEVLEELERAYPIRFSGKESILGMQ